MPENGNQLITAHPTPRHDRAGTHCEDYEIHGCRAPGCPDGCYIRLSEETRYQGLAHLLAALCDPARRSYRGGYDCNLGAAGHLQLTIDVDPALLTTEQRDTLLSTAARLINCNHTPTVAQPN